MTSVKFGTRIPINLSQPKKKDIGMAVVNFRPKVGWKGEFGFDWLRIGDDDYNSTTRKDNYSLTLKGGCGYFKKNPAPVSVLPSPPPVTVTIGGVTQTVHIGRPDQNMKEEDALELLALAHDKMKILRPVPLSTFEGDNYFVSYLNIYPRGAVDSISMRTLNIASGGTIISTESPKSEAELRLAIEVLEDVGKIELEYNKHFFSIDKPVLVDTTTNAGTKFDANIKIKCEPESSAPQTANDNSAIAPPQSAAAFDGFDTKQTILAWAYPKDSEQKTDAEQKALRRLAGKLVVLPNSAKQRKHIDIVYVNVIIDPSGANPTASLAFTPNIIKHIQNTLHQSLIDCTIVAGPDLNMSADTMFKVGSPVAATATAPAKPTNTFIYPFSTATNQYVYSTIDSKTANMALYDYLETEYIKRFSAYAGYFFVFYIDAIGLYLPEGFDTNGIPISDPATQLTDTIILRGQGKDVGAHSVILFKNYQVATDTANPNAETGTVSHEILHGLGLHHSFANADINKKALYPEQKFVFSPSLYIEDAGGNIVRRSIRTDNVMDYPPAPQISTWFWQWKIINK